MKTKTVKELYGNDREISHFNDTKPDMYVCWQEYKECGTRIHTVPDYLHEWYHAERGKYEAMKACGAPSPPDLLYISVLLACIGRLKNEVFNATGYNIETGEVKS